MIRIRRSRSFDLLVAPLVAPLVILFASLVTLPLGAQSPKGARDVAARELPAPQKIWAAQTSPTEVTLVWAPVRGATGYEVLAQQPGGALTVLRRIAGPTVARAVLPASSLGRGGEAVPLLIRAIANGASSEAAPFNAVALATPGAAKSLVAPSNVRIAETSPGVITVTWDEVPGATAYSIGRVTGTSGLQRYCDLCPTGGMFVDTVQAGVRHAYGIVAITPWGASRRVVSDTLTATGTAMGSGVAAGGGGASGKGVAASGGSEDADWKALAASARLTVGRDASGPQGAFGGSITKVVGRLITTITPVAQQLTGQVMRQVCDGPFQQILAPFTIERDIQWVDNISAAVLSPCRQKQLVPVNYKVLFLNPKGGVSETMMATVELPPAVGSEGGDGGRVAGGSGGGASGGSGGGESGGSTGRTTGGTTSGSDPKGAASATGDATDPKGLASAAQVTIARAESTGPQGMMLNALMRVLGNVLTPLGKELGQVTAVVMRQVCDGPFQQIANLGIVQRELSWVDDIATSLLEPCNRKDAVPVRYKVRYVTAKGGYSESAVSTIELPAVVASGERGAVTRERPATPPAANPRVPAGGKRP